MLIFSLALALSTLPASGLDALDMQLFKGVVFTQTSNGAPALATNSPYAFQAVIIPTFASLMTNASVETAALDTDLMEFNNQTNFAFMAAVASQTALDAAYGAGTYNFNYKGLDDGQTSVPISLGADDFPLTPVVSNVVAALSLMAGNDFTVTFAADANPNDFVQLTVVDVNEIPVFETPPIYYSEGLSATNTAIDIPAGTLTPGATYTAMLEFVRLSTLDVDTLPFIEAGFFTETTFPIQTQSTNGGGTETNVPPTAPLAPDFFTGSSLSFTISAGSGSFASSGAYQLFTSPMGSNYVILGPAGQGLSSGTYAYTMTGTNSATMALVDSQLGAGLSLQILFEAAGSGDYAITSSAEVFQRGAFGAATNYTTVTPANLFLPASSNGVFQSYFSGQVGGSYALQTSSNMTLWSALANFSLADLTTNVSDATATHGRFYRTRLNSITFAPVSVAGETFNMSITGGASPLTNNGIFQFLTSTNGATYQIVGGPGAANGAGSYTYSATGLQTATVSYTDSTTGVSGLEHLFFTSAQTGFFYLTQAGSPGFQSGGFTLSQGVVLFLGNVKFTPDAERTGSAFFPANGSTSVSLSVTDVVGYVWSLKIPSDALRTPTTISMAPFAGIDSSASLMTVSSGVQLSPDGAQFQDGLLLTVTAPAGQPGGHVTLAMADGHGANMYFVETTNHGNSYATTLFHFSSGSLGNVDPAPTGGALGAAFQSALAAIQRLEAQPVAPPVPPDAGFACDDQNNAAAAQYSTTLFGPEVAAIQQLESADSAYVAAIGSDPNAAQIQPLIRGLIESSCYRKVDFLFTYYNTQGLKYFDAVDAATQINAMDQLNGGIGRPDWTAQLAAWVSGPVVDYYLNNLKSKHDYTAATAVDGLKVEFQIHSADPSAMIEKFANALTFQVQMTINDNGPDLTIGANGAFKVTGGGDNLFPLGADDVMNYTSGTLFPGGPNPATLQVPLSWVQQVIVPSIVGCSQPTINVLLSTPGFNESAPGVELETWIPAPASQQPNFTEGYLPEDFSSAFQTKYFAGATYLGMYPAVVYLFPCILANGSPNGVGDFTGSGFFSEGNVTLNITLQHMPQ